MKQVNTHEAKTHLSRLVDAAAKGEPFIIAKGGKPLVKVEAVEPWSREDIVAQRLKMMGAMEGKWTIPDDIDRYAEDEILDMFGLN